VRCGPFTPWERFGFKPEVISHQKDGFFSRIKLFDLTSYFHLFSSWIEELYGQSPRTYPLEMESTRAKDDTNMRLSFLRKEIEQATKKYFKNPPKFRGRNPWFSGEFSLS
jgi:hypothetical protein